MEIYAAQQDFLVAYLETVENATLDERTAAFTQFGEVAPAEIVSRTENSSEAVITIAGLLTPEGPSPIARFFGYGGTGYNDIIAAANSLADDPTVETVRLAMDTPGGTVAGMDPARQALQNLASKKTVIAENKGLLASAGYYLASVASRIDAVSPLAVSGSIGVIQAGYDYSEALARDGIKKIRIVSSNAPNKQPDPATSQGRDILQDGIDALERVFIHTIAEGRGTTAQDVIDNFGKGGVLIAQDPDPDKPDALTVGMIDSVIVGLVAPVAKLDLEEDNDTASIIGGGDLVIPEIEAAAGGEQQGGTVMDLNKLKAEHGALFAEVLALGVEQGKGQERERAEAHITMGEASGDTKFALACIADGSELTAKVNATYMAASMNKKATGDRAAEGEGDLDVNASEEEGGESAELIAATAAALGVPLNV